ncbi:hypothetical protein BB558_004861 [Smittium angustum]|uniref:Peptidase S1 domain-containing protein n=1 Tax=Smittium angustum TaxID=133377 RepID=A0A2U1J248_SMIAN|nr:hypothetical protein BB558_004861 [Smittium angustum]
MKFSTLSTVFMAISATVFAQNSTDTSDDVVIANIINGKAASTVQYPFISQIFRDFGNKQFSFICTGSLIDQNYIVTAGHCVNDENYNLLGSNLFKVYAGSETLLSPTDKRLRTVTKIYTHGYSSKTPELDIAILKLSSPITAAEATPVKFYAYKINDNLPVEVAGFGVTNYGSNTPSNQLLKTLISVSSSQNCTDYGVNWSSNSGPQICSESYTGNDSCQGDSGGPLVAKINGNRVLVGVTSWGTNKDSNSNVLCGENVIAYYTRSGYFLTWIASVLGVDYKKILATY